uniref:Coiled-coil domain containing 33 n=1 Tax=Petromyzon marinus TaxID=7757 RepID=S4RC10_PETMA
MARTKLKIEEKRLDFVFEILNVQFNEKGRYQLRLMVENPLLESAGKGVMMREASSREVLRTNAVSTDVVEQANLTATYSFKKSKFIFTLPAGFCKNDKNHDVRLRAVATRTEGRERQRAGEGFFAIYPRTDTPRIDLYARRGQDLYRYRGVLALLRVRRDELAMHCGRLAYEVALHEHKPLPPQPPPPPPPPPPPETAQKHDAEPPICPRVIDPEVFHVSRPGKETVTLILHGVSSLPPPSDGGVPRPFAAVKSDTDEQQSRAAQGVTHASSHPTHSPSWEETVSVEIDENKADDEVVVVNVADENTKELLVSYRLPVWYLQPFHHYHLELVKPDKRIAVGIRLFASVVRKGKAIPRQHGFAFTSLEVLLRAVEEPLKDPAGPILAAARIVPDFVSYRNSLLQRTPRAFGINITTINFPMQHLAAFHTVTSQGHPQVSAGGFPKEQPQWDHTFLFHSRDCATAFTADAALILEFYQLSTVMNAASWHSGSPVGISVVPLGDDMYHRLMEEGCKQGIRLDRVPVHSKVLKTRDDGIPSVGLILRLIESERPDSLLTTVDPGSLPVLNNASLEKKSTRFSKSWVTQPLPSSARRGSQTPRPSNNRPLGDQIHHDQEVETYRVGMRRMAEDILSLRNEVMRLEIEKSELRRQMSLHRDAGRLLLSDGQFDVELKQKLASETVTLRSYKEKVQKLQNELIWKADREKELVRLQLAHRQQQAVLLRYQERAARPARLEDTVRQQEKVIEKMEKLLERSVASNSNGKTENKSHKGNVFFTFYAKLWRPPGNEGERTTRDMQLVLLVENARLRHELEMIRAADVIPTIHMVMMSTILVEPFHDQEKLGLLARLERAEGRTHSLEEQIQENARRWGQEKQDLLDRLTERQHGFTRTSTLIF